MSEKKRYMIHCDLEGISGVVRQDQVNPSKPSYNTGQKLFMAEVKKLVEGLHEGGAEEIYLYDHHYFGTNIDIMAMPAYSKVICGKPLYKDNWTGEKNSPYTGVILLGFHSKSETPGGLLAHSYEHDIKDIRVNGFSVGEIGMEAAIAGEFGVPVLLVTGDSEGIKEAEKIISNIRSVVVKESVDFHSAVCYPMEHNAERIKNAAKEIAQSPPNVNLFKFDSPIKLEVELYDTPFLKMMEKHYGEVFKGSSNVVTLDGEKLAGCWKKYIERKLHCLSELEGR